mgnify:CR=1 FL=1
MPLFIFRLSSIAAWFGELTNLSGVLSSNLNCNRCFNRRPRVIIHELEVLELEFKKVLDFGIEFHGRELARRAGQLLAGLLEVVGVQVRIAESMDKLARLVVAYLREHKRQKRVRRDIEGHPEERVGTALVKLATEFALANKKTNICKTTNTNGIE